MVARNATLVASLAIIGLLAFLTVDGILENGLNGLAVVSLIVLALLGFGVLGALTQPPRE